MGEAVRMFDVLDLTSLGQNGRICSCLPQAVACGGCVRYGLESSWFLLPRSCGGGARDSRSQISKWPCANCLPTSPAAVCPSSSSKQGATPPAPQRKVAKQARQAHAGMRFSGQPTPTPSSGRIRWPRPYRFPLPHQSSASEPPPFSARAARGP